MSRDSAHLAVFGVGIALLFAAGFALGWSLSSVRNANAIAAAKADTVTCTDAAAAQTKALADVKQSLAKQKADAEAAQARADAALQTRDAEITTIEQRGARDAAALRKQGHEDADSAVLARLAVPAALAGRLWPGQAASAGAATTH